MSVKIVAFLQNQWYRDPVGTKAVFDRYPKRRADLIEAFLFMGCKTGKVLKTAFGDDLCYSIHWEEASPEIGGHSSSAFPADPVHMQWVIDEQKPALVLTFGNIARDGLAKTGWTGVTVHFPHPAARTLKPADIKLWRRQLEAALLPSTEGVYKVRGIWGRDQWDEIDVYLFEPKGLCVFGPDYGYDPSESPLEDACHVSVQFTGLEFGHRLRGLSDPKPQPLTAAQRAPISQPPV